MMVDKITWFGQASVRIKTNGKTIYIDPYMIKNQDNADIVLITHSHSDHLSISDISKVVSDDTTFIAPQDCVQKIENKFNKTVIVLEPGQSTEIGQILIQAVPAYNVVKTQFHSKEKKWVGYILTIDGKRIYHAGDTERIPEMKDYNPDIAMIPIGQTYTMDSVKQAADAALDLNAEATIPIHYGIYEGTAADAQKFKNILAGKLKVIIKDHE